MECAPSPGSVSLTSRFWIVSIAPPSLQVGESVRGSELLIAHWFRRLLQPCGHGGNVLFRGISAQREPRSRLRVLRPPKASATEPQELDFADGDCGDIVRWRWIIVLRCVRRGLRRVDGFGDNDE